MKKVIIRADSSSTIGTGHIMRDIVLAKREFPHDRVVFAVRELQGNINHKIDKAGFEKVTLESNDIDELAELVSKHRADTVVIDHYGIGHEDEKRLKEQTGATLFVLDDTYEKHYCDILLNHNIYAETERYKDLVPKYCELRCGEKFMLIRDEFHAAKKEKEAISLDPKGKTHVFVAMGGADTANLNISILKVLSSFTNTHAHIVTTSANSHLETLKSYCANNPDTTLYVNTDKIAKLMAGSDFAIATPSVTLNEVFFMQLPFIAIQTADNQKEMVAFLQKNDYPVLKYFNQKLLKSKIEKIIKGPSMKIAILTSPNQWFIPYAEQLSSKIDAQLYFDHASIKEKFDVLFILSYHQIIPKQKLQQNKHNIVIHASDLPKGKGWAPMFWQILEGRNEIPFTMFEAGEGIDDGDIYMKRTLQLNGYELNQKLREKQAKMIIKMCLEFINNYERYQTPSPQEGVETFYPKRSPKDSKLDIDKSIKEQFNLLRIVDNESYPAFFEINGHRYILKIEKAGS